MGLLLDVYSLATQLMQAKRAKQQQFNSLEHLGQNLARYGALRALERPFKRQMCAPQLQKRRAWTKDGGSKTPMWSAPLCFKENCGCEKAHHPSELRFPAGESVKRRAEWLENAKRQHKYFDDAMIPSESYRSKLMKGDRP